MEKNLGILNYSYLKIPFKYLGLPIGRIQGNNNLGKVWLAKSEIS